MSPCLGVHGGDGDTRNSLGDTSNLPSRASDVQLGIQLSPFKAPWGGGAGVICLYHDVRGSLEIHGDTFFSLGTPLSQKLLTINREKR